MLKKIASLTATLALALTAATPAFAYTTTANLYASLTVLPVCSIAVQNGFNFSNIGAGTISGSFSSPSTPTTNANITYTCTGSANFLELSDAAAGVGVNDFVLTNNLNQSTLPFVIWASLNNGPGQQVSNGGGAGQGAFNLGTASGTNSILLAATVDPTSSPVAEAGTYSDNILATLDFS